MQKHSNDYIPTYADQMRTIEAKYEYMATHKDPRSTYTITYKIGDKEMTEDIIGFTQKEAVEGLEDSWRRCGVYINVVSAYKKN